MTSDINCYEKILKDLCPMDRNTENWRGMNPRICNMEWVNDCPDWKAILKQLELDGMIVLQRFNKGVFNVKMTPKGVEYLDKIEVSNDTSSEESED